MAFAKLYSAIGKQGVICLSPESGSCCPVSTIEVRNLMDWKTSHQTTKSFIYGRKVTFRGLKFELTMVVSSVSLSTTYLVTTH